MIAMGQEMHDFLPDMGQDEPQAGPSWGRRDWPLVGGAAEDDDARDQSDFLQAYDELMYKDMSHDELVARIKLQDDEILRLRATVRDLKSALESK